MHQLNVSSHQLETPLGRQVGLAALGYAAEHATSPGFAATATRSGLPVVAGRVAQWRNAHLSPCRSTTRQIVEYARPSAFAIS